MLKRLTQPYPILTVYKRLQIALFVGLFVFIFLITLEPFDLNLLKTDYKILKIAGYGFIGFIGLTVFYTLLPQLFLNIFDDSNWKLYKELIWLLINILIIGCFISIYESIVCICPFSILAFSETIAKTLIIGLLPVSVITLTNQNYNLRKNLKKVQSVSNSLKNIKDIDIKKPDSITIQSDISETLSFNPDNFILANAEDNYTTFSLNDKGQIKKVLLRVTLKNVEKQMDFPFVTRCHRSYLVNLLKIESINGNASGYRLEFTNINKEVPVSRQNSKIILQSIRNIEKSFGSKI